MTRVPAMIVVSLLAACAPTPDLAHYDRTCAVDEDCELVPIDDPCAVCSTFEGIATDDASSYRDAWARAVSSQCGNTRALIDCAPPAVVPRCLGGTCRAAPTGDTDG